LARCASVTRCLLRRFPWRRLLITSPALPCPARNDAWSCSSNPCKIDFLPSAPRPAEMWGRCWYMIAVMTRHCPSERRGEVVITDQTDRASGPCAFPKGHRNPRAPAGLPGHGHHQIRRIRGARRAPTSMASASHAARPVAPGVAIVVNVRGRQNAGRHSRGDWSMHAPLRA